jgi:hypothetical protein
MPRQVIKMIADPGSPDEAAGWEVSTAFRDSDSNEVQ